MIIDVAGGGGLTNKYFDDAYALVEEMDDTITCGEVSMVPLTKSLKKEAYTM